MKLRHLTLTAIAVIAAHSFLFSAGPIGEANGTGSGAYGSGLSVALNDSVQAIRDDLVALRTALAVSRQVVLESLSPGVSLEDRAIALNAWTVDNGESIATMRTLSGQLQDAICDATIMGKQSPMISTASVRMVQTELSVLARTLARSKSEVLGTLPGDATAADRKEALLAWERAHTAELVQWRALRDEVTAWRDGNGGAREARHGLSMRLRDQLQAYKTSAQQLKGARNDLNLELLLASDAEERQALLQTFRHRYRELMAERMQLKRLERLAGADVSGGRRRGG